MDWKAWIGSLDFKSNETRRKAVKELLDVWQVPYEIQRYETGENLMVTLGNGPRYTAVSCHTDRAPRSGGANDNGAAMAVCLELIHQFKDISDSVKFFFFDEEENRLRGSRAYVKAYGIESLKRVVNLELVGRGKHLIGWPAHPESLELQELIADTCEEADPSMPPVVWLPEFMLYYSDADAFIEAGMEACITLTKTDQADYQLGREVLEGKTAASLDELAFQSELMRYYHNKEDHAGRLRNDDILHTVSLVKAIIQKSDSL